MRPLRPRRSHRVVARLAMALGLAAALAGCIVSPQPSPPEPELDGFGVGLGPSPELLTDQITFTADPGTVDPAEGVVVVTNLETDDAPSLATVEPDGSFAIAVRGALGDTFRFQAKVASERSEPVDLRVDAQGLGLTPAEDALPCLVVEPATWIALDGGTDAQSLVVRNDCDVAVSVAAPRLRRGRGPFTFSPTSPLELAPGDATTITVRASGGGSEREDVLFLEIASPTPARRALTLTLPDG